MVRSRSRTASSPAAWQAARSPGRGRVPRITCMPDIDHTRMTPPSLRIVREHPLAGEDAYVWDFRIAQPNVAHLAMPVIHSIEHFLGTALPAASPKVLHVGVMGCQTGFNIVTIGISSFDEMSDLVADALRIAVDAS